MSNYQIVQYYLKICFDKVLATILLLTFIPIFIITSILIKLDSKGPVIFKQKRIGRRGKLFNIYKFRTMCDGAMNLGDGIFVSKNDSRITKIGKFLRKTSLDELPQLINILKSEMSFVGPRPPLENHPYKFEDYDDLKKLRFEVLPGITGYAQAYGRNSIRWPERIEMDIFYYNNFSLIFDLKIILVTVATVLFSRGIYSSRDNNEKLNEIKTEKEGV